MNPSDHSQLTAERASVESMLMRLPATSVLDRKSLEARIAAIDNRLAELPGMAGQPASAKLTFRGRPVLGTSGIFADFAARATVAFTELVDVVVAGASGNLPATGAIPNREESQLLITGTATGSFGFEFTENISQQLLPFHESAAEIGLQSTLDLLAATIGTDDDVTQIVAGSDARIIRNLRSFLDVLASNEAVCTMAFKQDDIRFPDVESVRRALKRLADDQVHEEVQRFYGSFEGVLPKLRTFEFRVAADDSIIRGKVGSEIEKPEVINQHLHESIDISLVATRVGAGRPRYVLRTLPTWNAGD